MKPRPSAYSISRSLAALAIIAVVGSIASAQVTLRRVLVSGEQAPSSEPGTIVTYTRALSIGDNGHIAVGANTSSGPALAYLGRPDNLTLWLTTGDPAPGMEPGVTIVRFGVNRVTRGGGTAAFCYVEGPGVEAYNHRAIYIVHPDGSMHLALRDGQPAPQWGDGTGVEFGTLNPLVDYYAGTGIYTIADDLRFLKPVRVGGSTVLYGGFAHDPRIQIREGAAAPGIPGATVTHVRVASESQPIVAGTGKIVLRGTIAGSGIDATNNEVFWSGELDALQVLLRKGDPVPGTHPENRAAFSGDLGSWMTINDAGQTLFWSRLAAGMGDTNGSNDGVVLVGAPGSLAVAARKGDQVPGLPTGVVYADITWGHIGNGGVMGLVASLSGPGIADTNNNDSAILTGLPGAIVVRMREGQQVPGLPAHYVFGNYTASSARWLFFNRIGGFVARVPIVDLADDNTVIDSIIYGAPDGGPPTVVLRGSDTVEVAPGDVREFYRALPVGLSDSGEILINLQFDEDEEATGVFIATVGSPGACCEGTECSIASQSACSGVFQGPGTACGAPDNPITCCPANYNGIDGVGLQDLFAFLSDWFAQDTRADFNGIDGVGLQDLFDFLSAWFIGCH